MTLLLVIIVYFHLIHSVSLLSFSIKCRTQAILGTLFLKRFSTTPCSSIKCFTTCAISTVIREIRIQQILISLHLIFSAQAYLMFEVVQFSSDSNILSYDLIYLLVYLFLDEFQLMTYDDLQYFLCRLLIPCQSDRDIFGHPFSYICVPYYQSVISKQIRTVTVNKMCSKCVSVTNVKNQNWKYVSIDFSFKKKIIYLYNYVKFYVCSH